MAAAEITSKALAQVLHVAVAAQEDLEGLLFGRQRTCTGARACCDFGGPAQQAGAAASGGGAASSSSTSSTRSDASGGIVVEAFRLTGSAGSLVDGGQKTRRLVEQMYQKGMQLLGWCAVRSNLSGELRPTDQEYCLHDIVLELLGAPATVNGKQKDEDSDILGCLAGVRRLTEDEAAPAAEGGQGATGVAVACSRFVNDVMWVVGSELQPLDFRVNNIGTTTAGAGSQTAVPLPMLFSGGVPSCSMDIEKPLEALAEALDGSLRSALRSLREAPLDAPLEACRRLSERQRIYQELAALERERCRAENQLSAAGQSSLAAPPAVAVAAASDREAAQALPAPLCPPAASPATRSVCVVQSRNEGFPLVRSLRATRDSTLLALSRNDRPPSASNMAHEPSRSRTPPAPRGAVSILDDNAAAPEVVPSAPRSDSSSGSNAGVGDVRLGRLKRSAGRVEIQSQ